MKINGLIELYVLFHYHICLTLDEALDGYTASLNGFLYTSEVSRWMYGDKIISINLFIFLKIQILRL